METYNSTGKQNAVLRFLKLLTLISSFCYASAKKFPSRIQENAPKRDSEIMNKYSHSLLKVNILTIIWQE